MVLNLTSYLTYGRHKAHDNFPDVYYFVFTCVVDLKRFHAHDIPLSSEFRISLGFIIRHLFAFEEKIQGKEGISRSRLSLSARFGLIF